MLRTNLSTRPFYNERGVRAGARRAGRAGDRADAVQRLRDHAAAGAEPRFAADDRAERSAGASRCATRRRSSAARSIATKLDAVQVGRERGQRADRSPHLLVDRAAQPVPGDAAARRAHCRRACRRATTTAAGSCRSRCFRDASKTSKSSWTRSRRPARSPACCRDRISRTKQGTLRSELQAYYTPG